ncbi:MAG: DUF1800 domain-containing protein [Planctomycetota bacterium]|jgi:uncharacterized protein (DUF1800 family)
MAANSLRALRADAFDYWSAQHLLHRAGFGGTPSQVRALANMGLNDAVDQLVEYEAVPFRAVEPDEFDAGIMRPATAAERQEARRARQSGDEAAIERLRRRRQAAQQADRLQMARIQQWWLRRMIETPRPLEEKLTLFWHGHFATSYRGIEDSYHMFLQNQFLRANATGSFADLVFGIIRDPAMLRYLNNNQNRKQRPNENLARELMELFVLGEGNDYTEDDIKQGARALTGYTYNDDEFIFRPGQHDDGPKRILGQVGPWDGDDFARIILGRKIASEFICWKLYRFFVNDLPGLPDENAQVFIRKLARRMRDGNYQLKPVLKTLFRSEHFYDPANVASQIKSPVQFIVQSIRSLRTPVRHLGALLGGADLMGQNIFYPPSVKGWDGGRAWINTSTLFVRQNMMIYLLTGRKPDGYAWQRDGGAYDATHLVDHLRPDDGPIPAEDAARYLLRFGFGTEPRPDRVRTLVTFIDEHGGLAPDDRLNGKLIALLSLITVMPEYQLC